MKVGEEGGARGVQRGGGVAMEGAAVGGCRFWRRLGGLAGEDGLGGGNEGTEGSGRAYP